MTEPVIVALISAGGSVIIAVAALVLNNGRFNDMNSRFNDMNSRFNDMNSRLDKIERTLEVIQADLKMFYQEMARIKAKIGLE